ncbi:hypothetical protein GGR57DRAFT_77631 [Xylariaceae sp. FL1272]|nr:hypothetical protein GGR57DRAFT_77631 [Xylariaceae sp. FL1272]
MRLKQELGNEDTVGRNMTAFTALNGVEPKTAEASSGSPTLKHGISEERSGIQPPSGQESGAARPSIAHSEQVTGSNPDRSAYTPTSYNEANHKRKRSVSIERPRDVTSGRDQGQHSRPDSRDAYEASLRERDYRHYGDDRREQTEHWYSQQAREDRSSYDARDTTGSAPPQMDEELEGARRRATSQAESRHDFSATSPDGDDGSLLYSGAYSPDQSRDPVIHSDPKKRKRNFSNRTKTGTNCLRGGFICYGYPNQRGHPKLENKPAAVPLESKDPSYIPPGAYGMPQSSAYPNPPAPTAAPPPPIKRDSVSSYRGPYLRLETSHPRPSQSDDDRPTASTIPTASAVSSILSPDNKASAFSAYSSAANMFPTPISAITPSMQLKTPNIERPREFTRVPPLHDLTRTEPDSAHPDSSHPTSLPQMNVLEPTPPAQSAPAPPSATDPQTAAQLALSHPSYPPNPNRTRTQKENMLAGREFYPFDQELTLERQRCSAACWRFNNSTNPNTGVSANERTRLFREILQPREPIHISPQLVSSSSPMGRSGGDVIVEAPFTCDYGYNITIGNNVLIGRNCTILDPMPINIGDNCFIGPNVTLLGATTYVDPKKRNGVKSPMMGGAIVVDEDVWIGAGAIIQHGIRIGKGATISAGAVVVKVSPNGDYQVKLKHHDANIIFKDVPRFTIVAGNPAEVTSGVNH